MTDTPMVAMFRGERVDEMTREELLEVVDYAFREIERLRDSTRRTSEMQKMFADARSAREARKSRLHRVLDALLSDPIS